MSSDPAAKRSKPPPPRSPLPPRGGGSRLGRTIRWLVVFVVLVLGSSFALHHVKQSRWAMPTPVGALSVPLGSHGQRLHVHCVGVTAAAKEVLVVHHGNLVNALFYAKLQRELVAKERIASCAVDRPGMGWSPAPSVPSASLATDALHVVQAVRQFVPLTARLVHLGHSGGGSYAVASAVAQSDAGLILLDPLLPRSYECADFVNTMENLGALLSSNLLKFLQLSGLRRVISYLDRPSAVFMVPAGGDDLVRAHIQLALSDSVTAGEREGFLASKRNVDQLNLGSGAVIRVPTTVLTSDPSVPSMFQLACMNAKATEQALQVFAPSQAKMVAGTDHMTLAQTTSAEVAAAFRWALSLSH